MEDETIYVYKPAELMFDVKIEDSGRICVFLRVIAEEDFDCLDSAQVEGLPKYLTNASENEWTLLRAHEGKIAAARIIDDMQAAGFTYNDTIIDWI